MIRRLPSPGGRRSGDETGPSQLRRRIPPAELLARWQDEPSRPAGCYQRRFRQGPQA
jgi:hypothetical protein